MLDIHTIAPYHSCSSRRSAFNSYGNFINTTSAVQNFMEVRHMLIWSLTKGKRLFRVISFRVVKFDYPSMCSLCQLIFISCHKIVAKAIQLCDAGFFGKSSTDVITSAGNLEMDTVNSTFSQEMG